MLNHRKIRALRHTYRFNFHHVNSRQNVAEHSFYVAIYAREFAKIIFSNDSFSVAQTVKMALEHDFEEAIIGDIPYLIRKQMSDSLLKELNTKAMDELGVHIEEDMKYSQIKSIVDFADAFELKIYLEEERKSGNVGLYQIERETYKRLIDSPLYDLLTKHFSIEPVRPARMTEFMSHEGD